MRELWGLAGCYIMAHTTNWDIYLIEEVFVSSAYNVPCMYVRMYVHPADEEYLSVGNKQAKKQ